MFKSRSTSTESSRKRSLGRRRGLLAGVATLALGLALSAPAGAQGPAPLEPAGSVPAPLGPSTSAPAPLGPSASSPAPLTPSAPPRDPVPGKLAPLEPGTHRVQVKVMSYNINSLAFPHLKYPKGVTNASRDKASAAIIEFTDPDVVVIDEAFDAPALELADRLKVEYPYQTPVVGRSCPAKDDEDQGGWNGTYGDCKNGLQYIRGGTMILSKLPILEQWQYVYKSRAAWWMPGIGLAWTDGLANKGVALVALRAPGGGVFWVAGTHLQSGDSDNGRLESIRKDQLKEMRDFIAQRANYRKEAVLLAGDLNIPIYLDGLDSWGGQLPVVLSDPFTLSLFTTLKESPGGVSVNCTINTIACDAQAASYPPGYEDSLDYVGYIGPGQGDCCVEPADMTPPQTIVTSRDRPEGAPSDHFPVMSTFTLALPNDTQSGDAGKSGRGRRSAR